MPRFITAEQGTPEWHQARLGCLTASRMKDALDYTAKGAEGAKRKQLKLDLMAETFTGQPTPVFVNGAMKWGTETEPEARIAYSSATGNDVEQVGFCLHDSIPYFGCSPDGLVGDDGMVEIKCPASSTMVQWLIYGVIPEDHIPQLITQCAVAGRKWVDFVAFDPRMAEPYRMFIRRFTPTPEQIEEVEAEARKIARDMKEMYAQIQQTIGGGK